IRQRSPVPPVRWEPAANRPQFPQIEAPAPTPTHPDYVERSPMRRLTHRFPHQQSRLSTVVPLNDTSHLSIFGELSYILTIKSFAIGCQYKISVNHIFLIPAKKANGST